MTKSYYLYLTVLLIGQYCFAPWRLSSSVTLPGGRHSTAGQ